MDKRERNDLAGLVRKRERLAKANVDQIGAERLADFEEQLASVYQPADDPVWLELHAAAAEVVDEARRQMAARCRDLGIPPSAAPNLELYWYGRGENAFADRRAELRKVAATRIAADGKRAKVEVERRSLEVQEQLLIGGLESDEAKAFVEAMPRPEQLVPQLTVAQVETEMRATRGANRQRHLGMPDQPYLGIAAESDEAEGES